MRITVLSYVEREDSEQPDLVVGQVVGALERAGHKVSILCVHRSLKKLVAAVEKQKPDLVFNLVEMWGDDLGGDVAVAGALEMLGVRFTGGGPCELALAVDKVLAKKLLVFEKIKTPRFAVYARGREIGEGQRLKMPVFVKPVAMDASIGIGKKSLVRDQTALLERVREIHQEHKDDALAEEFIDGREFYVGVLGNRDALALPPIEADFSRLPDGSPKIYDRAAKWEPGTPEHDAIRTMVADIPDELAAKLQKISLDAYRAVRVRDYGRVDLRVAESGEIYVLEVNASCYLEQDDEFAVAARAAGIGYDDLIARIVELAVSRQ